MNTRWTGLLSFRTAVLLILMLLPASAWAAAGEAGVPSFEGPLDVARAYRLYDAGRLEEAEAAFLALTAEDPTNLDAQEGLTWTYLTRGKHEEAARSADTRLALAPDDEQWRQRWIEIIHQLPARREEAIAAAEALLKKRPDDLGARRLRGRLLSWTPGREEEARELFDALIAENGRDAEALYGRSEIARWAGDYETANRLLRRAAEADPENKRIRAALASVEAQARQLGAARKGISLPLIVALVAFCVPLGMLSRKISPRTYAALVVYTVMLLGLGLLWLHHFPYQ